MGDGPLRAKLEEMARSLGIGGKVIFRGSSLDVPSFFAGIDTFVLCSLSEGLPLTLIEAMAAGLPVVGTDVGAIPEMVEATQCGWICRRGEPEGLAAALLQAFRCENRGERGRRGREYVVCHNSVESMTGAYELLFRRLLEADRTAASGISQGTAQQNI